MGRVSSQITELVRRHLRDAGIVVWYDPDRAYERLLTAESFPGPAAVIRYEGSFLELRHRLEPYLELVGPDGRILNDGLSGRPVLVHVPADRRDSHDALIEAEAAGTVLEPGANPWQRNTRLRVVAERVFKDIAPDRAAEIARQVESGGLTLDDLDRLAEQSAAIGAGALGLIFGTTAIEEVALRFAAGPDLDREIDAKQSLDDLRRQLQGELGLSASAATSPAELREALRRLLLLSDLVSAVRMSGGSIRELDQAVPADERHLQTAARICRAWRNRADLRESYAAAAHEVDTIAQVDRLNLDATWVAETETLPSLERFLLDHAEQCLLDKEPERARALAARRKRSFWSSEEPENQLRWSLVETAALVQIAAARITAQSRQARRAADEMVDVYVAGEAAWCLLDTHHRHMERQFGILELDPGGGHARLERAIRRSRQAYGDTVALCADTFARALEQGDFAVSRERQQVRVFSTYVAPRLRCRDAATAGEAQRCAYVVVDALRYEMGRELIGALGADFDVELHAALAQIPTITEVGMAALLPGAETGAELVDAGGGRCALRIGETTAKDRATRVRHLVQHARGETVVLKLNDLVRPSKKTRDEVERAALVYVTSQEIDRRGEAADDEDETRRFMDEVLDKIRRALRSLAVLGISTIVISSDHGHLYGEALESGMKIDPPGGTTVDLHRRVWIGRGGAAADGFIRLPARRIGLGGDLELAFPRGLACFKAVGPTAYYHGGMSLQEMVVPVIVARPRAAAAAATRPLVELTMERRRVTTRFLSVTAAYRASGLFGAEEQRVRILVRAQRADVGRTATAAYGFEDGTQEVILRKDQPDAVTLMLTQEISAPAVSIHALDAASGIELGRLDDVELSLIRY